MRPAREDVVETRRTTLADLTLVENRFPPRYTLGEHHHEHAFFCLAVQGPFSEWTGRQVLERRTGDLLFHAPGETHADGFPAGGGACFNIEFGPTWSGRLHELLPRLTRARHGRGAAGWYAERILGQARRPSPASALEVEGLTLLLLSEASQSHERLDRWGPPRWLDRVRGYLHDTFRANPTIVDAGREVHIHPVHVARVFRRAHGCTIGSYVQRLRLAHACRLLAGGRETLAWVAEESGFADQSHLTRALKQATGLTPAEYRRRTAGS